MNLQTKLIYNINIINWIISFVVLALHHTGVHSTIVSTSELIIALWKTVLKLPKYRAEKQGAYEFHFVFRA